MAEKDIIVNLKVNTGNSTQSVDELAKSEKDLAINTEAANVALKQSTSVTTQNANATEQAADANVSLRKQLRALQEQLGKLAVAGKQNTAEYKNLRNEAGKLKDAISDVNQEVSQAGSDTRGLDQTIRVATTATAAFSILEGATALFGKENEDLQKSLLKVTAAVSVLNGLQEIQAEIAKEDSIFTKAAAAAKLIYAAAVGTATGATKLFRIALLSTGIGLFIVALGLLIANFDKIKTAVSKFLPGLDQLQKGFNNVKVVLRGFADAALVSLTKVVKTLFIIPRTLFALFNEGLDGAIRVIKETGSDLTNLFGDAKAAYQSGANAQKELNAEAAKTRATQEQIKKLTLDIARVEATTGDARKLQLKKAQLELSLLEKGTIDYFEKLKEVNDIQKDLNETNKVAVKTNKELADQAQKSIDDINKLSTAFKSSDGTLQGLEKDLELLKQELVFANLNEQGTIVDVINQTEKAIQGLLQSNSAKQLETFFADNDKLSFKPNIIPDLENQLSTVQDLINNLGTEDANKNGLIKLFVDLQEEIRKAKEQLETLKQGDQQGLIGPVIPPNYEKELAEFNQKERDEKIKNAAIIGNEIFDIAKKGFNARQILLDNQLKQGLITEEQYAEKVKELRRKEAIAAKLQAVFNASINVASAISAALGKTGNPIVAGIVAGLAALQLAAIIATPIPKFFKGAIDLKRGIYPQGRDTIPAMLNEGESVMTTAETKRYKDVFTHIRNNTFESTYLPKMAYKILNVPNTKALTGIKLTGNGNRSDKAIEEELRMLRLMLREGNRINKRTADNTGELKKTRRRLFNV